MPIYDAIKNDNPEQLHKIIPLKGDLEEPHLGLSDDDVETVTKNVNCIFHVGASIKIVDHLTSLLRSNVIGTYEIIQLAKGIQNLQSFVYVSTAYSQRTKETIEEVLYESAVSGETMLLMAKTFDSVELDKMSPIIIVCSSWKEPLSGWTNPSDSLLNFMTAYGLGLAHVLIAQPQSVADIIPADCAINNIIAAAWEVGSFWGIADKSIRVYNCASSHQNPITTGKFEELLDKYDAIMPSNLKIWNRFVILSTNKILITLLYLLQLPLMYFLDIFNFLLGKPHRFIKLFKKVHTLITVTSHFVKNSWFFTTYNTTKLWDKLDENDKKLFDFNISAIDWDSVFCSCVKGIRLYILKESSKTIPKAQFRRHALNIIKFDS